MRHRIWQWYLAATLAGAVVYFLLPRAGLGQAIVYTGLTLACALALLGGICLYRPQHPAPWYVLAAGMLVYTAADVLWHTEPPFPSPADALFLTAYALLACGFIMLGRARVTGSYRETAIDSLVIAGGAGAVAWVFLMEPYVHASGLSTLARATAMAYPALDVLLLAAITSLLLAPGARRVAVGFLALGVAGQLIADVGYALSALDGSFRFGAPYFAGWFGAFVFIGAGALHPSRAGLSAPATRGGEAPQRWRLLVLTAAAMLAPATLVAKEATGRGDGETVLVVAGLAALLFALVLARVSGLMRELTEYRRLQALKDEFVSIVSHELRTPLTSRGAGAAGRRGARGLPRQG